MNRMLTLVMFILFRIERRTTMGDAHTFTEKRFEVLGIMLQRDSIFSSDESSCMDCDEFDAKQNDNVSDFYFVQNLRERQYWVVHIPLLKRFEALGGCCGGDAIFDYGNFGVDLGNIGR
jgi:hypothetical protein